MLLSRFTLGCLTLLATALATACTAPSPETSPESEAPSTETVEPSSVPETELEPTAEAAISNRTGTFVSAEHETTGGVTLSTTNGQSILVFDDAFSTSDGPDLVVVLHRSANVLQATTPPAYPLEEADYVVIAPLTTTNGTQEYPVPAEIDVSAFKSVAVWCQEFNATFGVAPLQ